MLLDYSMLAFYPDEVLKILDMRGAESYIGGTGVGCLPLVGARLEVSGFRIVNWPFRTSIHSISILKAR